MSGHNGTAFQLLPPLELDKEQVLDYLEHLKTQSKTPSSSYFKHMVYGLSFACRVTGKDASDISLPALKNPQKLPVILSQQDCLLSKRLQ